MKKMIVKFVDSLISNVIKSNINSTTSVAAFQPVVPKKLVQFKRHSK